MEVAAIIAVAANTDGRREIVGLHIGPSEAETFWSGFLKSLARQYRPQGNPEEVRVHDFLIKELGRVVSYGV
jgi:hypothetical protein